MKAPGFWRAGEGGLVAGMLSPASWAYQSGAALGRWFRGAAWKAPVPVICCGNVTAGGSGKTPVALAIARRLQAAGRHPHFLSRGYGGTEKGPLAVAPERHTAAEVGDEPLLLAAEAPAWIGADRAATARLAVAAGADVLVMDDGLQNGTLHQDLSLMVVDGGFGFGNGKLLPAGPLREPLPSAFGRIAAAVIVGDDETGVAGLLPPGLPVLRARVVPGPEAAELAGQTVVAFAGIGRPEKFFQTLAAAGAVIADAIPFPDHHPFSAADIAMLEGRAAALGARLVTTEKDRMRLAATAPDGIAALTIDLHWEDQGALDTLLTPLFDGTAHAG